MSTSTAEPNVCPAMLPWRPTDLYRVLLLRNNGAELLVASKRPPLTLPCVEIPRWERVAENINAAVSGRYGISAVCLFTPDASGNTADVDDPLYQVMEARECNCAPPPETYWQSIGSFSDQSFADPRDFIAIKNALQQIGDYQNDQTERSFAKLGWLEELLCWAQHQIDSYGLRLTGKLRQVNASPTFALLRLETNGPAVWFKAVGEPNLRELPISVVLSRSFSGFVPTIIATRPAWNGWLATECAGSTLDKVGDAFAWERAAQTIAELQIASIDKTHDLLEAGCQDLAVSSLLTAIGPFFQAMAELMERQQKPSPRPLQRECLGTLAVQIEEALSEWSDLKIPDTLGHLDFNPGNIVCSPAHCIFLDWAEAYVGPPFLTLEYLHEQLTRSRLKITNLAIEVVKLYAAKWSSILSPQTISAAQHLTPLLAVFAYAAGAPGWRKPTLLPDPSAAYFRSLTRRMHAEMDNLRGGRQFCCK